MTSAAKLDLTDIAAFAQRLPKVGTLIALDLGTKTIGLALSDRTRLIASPLETLKRTKQSADIAALLAHAARQETAGFVLGYPVNLDGTLGPRTQATQAFARALLQAMQARAAEVGAAALPVLLYDERWSTVSAERVLLEADMSRAKRAERIDMVAAVIILQAALERLAHSRSPD